MDDANAYRLRIEELERALLARDAQIAGLEENLAECKSVLEQLPAELAVKDAEGRYLFLNEASKRLYGFTEESYLGKLPTEVGFTGDAATLHAHDLEVLASEVPSSQIVRTDHDDGEHVFLAMKFPLRDANGAVRHLGVLGVDITQDVKALALEHLRSELASGAGGGQLVTQALRESEARYRAVVEDQTEQVCRLSPHGIVTFANQAFCEALGQSRERVMGSHRPFVRLTHPDDLAFVEAQRSGLTVQRPSCSYEHRVVRMDGEVRWQQWTDRALFDSRGQLVELQRVGRDITERVRAEIALRESEQKRLADARMAALGQLIATVAHELRHPLGTIRVSLATLTRRLTIQEARDLRTLERIDRNVDRALGIIDQLLSFSRDTRLHPRPVRLDVWLSQVLEDIDIPDPIRVERQLDCSDEVEVDPDRLQQALVNLVENAVHALRDDPDAARQGRLRIAAACGAAAVQISVSDNGPGIPEDLRAKIFEPLFTTKSFGVGLGLPLVQRVAEEHGGEVVIHAPPGVGTTVTLHLPRIAATPGC